MTVGERAPERLVERAQAKVFRTDIQALRALAIGLVVLNHLWPVRLTGGYVGVDVFFVISGFLITGHLLGEMTRTGRVRLGAFYARRVRRLLPAAFLVLTASLLLLVVFIPYPRWDRNAWEIAASAGYVENWLLAAMSVDYSALNDAASLVQHYWSLSVEEQFYIVWPLLLLAAVALAGHRTVDSGSPDRGARVTTALVIVVVGIGLLSFAASVLYTIAAPSQAYFATFTRGWEFAVGGVIALLGSRIRLSRLGANLFSLAGFASIAYSALSYDHATSFPGYAAVFPVLGTAAVILAGTSHEALWHSRATALRPVQWVGGISYSLYLWHWPLIVTAPFALGSEASTLSKIGVLVLALVLAELTKRFVEDTGQRWTFWRASTRRAMLLMITGMIVIGAMVAGVLVWHGARTEADRPPAQVIASPCEGPAALMPHASCKDAFDTVDYTVMTQKNEYFHAPAECGDFLPILSYGEKRTTIECDFSEGRPGARRIWLVGDSHAQQWQGALFDLARDRGWVVTTSYFGGCPAADITFRGFRGEWAPSDAELCMRWSRELADRVAEERPDLVLTAMASRLQFADDGSGTSSFDQMTRGLVNYWTRWADRGIPVLALADPPFNSEVRSPDCVLLNVDDPRECARPRAEAQPADPVIAAAGAAQTERIKALDLTDRFCDAELCYAAVGGVPVYYDADHLNLEYARMLRPELEAAVDELLKRSESG
ncbi:acyltransferase family protein [Microbacterium commune]|uniref:acyltransferase family protein n=1 Tax=Microbacterium commune TaxID=2762219 RepID=UPI00296FCFB4|nr:acyltransferase family protein [Microbacterium commune]